MLLPAKSGLADGIKKLLVQYKASGFSRKRIWCDNAGENKTLLKDVCNSFNVSIKYKAPGTPQYNSVVERKLATIGKCAQVMLKASPILEKLHKTLWGETIITATHLHNCSTQQNNTKTLYQKYPLKALAAQELVHFGSKGFVTKKQTQAKWKPKATKMFMVGYNLDGPPSSYRIFNPHTQRVIESCNIVWKPWQGKVFNPEDRIVNNVEVSDNKEDTLQQGGPAQNPTTGPALGQEGNAQQTAAAVTPAQALTVAMQPATTGTPT